MDAYWNSLWGQIIIELAGGIAGSFIFLFAVLLVFKPRVKMANFLCKVQPAGQASYYIFKFVNLSFFPAHDIKAELHLIKKIPMGNGLVNNTYKQLALLNGNISHISGRNLFWREQIHNPHCIIVRTMEDINSILSDENSAIVIKIALKHGLTGLSGVFEKEYANEEEIRKGKFKPGTIFEVL